VLDAIAQQIFRLVPEGIAGAEAGITSVLNLDTSFYRPRGFAVDPAGNLLVADTGGARVVMLGALQGGESEPNHYQVLAQYGGLETALGKGQPVDTLAPDNALWAITAEDGRL